MRLKRASQVGILEACWESCRPIRVRKVGGSGTKGVGGGIGGCGMDAWRSRDEVGRISDLWMRCEERVDGRSLVWVRMIIVDLME